MSTNSTEPASSSNTNVPPTQIPTTPQRHRRTSSSTSRGTNEDAIIPSTPPFGGNRRASQVGFRSPGEYTHMSGVVPPITPSSSSMNASNKFKLSNVPVTPYSAASGGGGDYGSPLKSPSQFQETDDGDKPPIRQITTKLRTRLNYALVKFSNGWTNQSLDELEKSVMDHENDDENVKLQEPFKNNQKTLMKSPSRVTKPTVKSPSRSVKMENRHSLGVLNGDGEGDGSANIAFIQAMAKSRSPRRPANINVNSNLRLDNTILNQGSRRGSENIEREAIESLMSLSSPQSFKPKYDFADNLHQPQQPQRALPRQRLSFGEKLGMPGKNNKKKTTSSGHENAIETESDTEYEEDSDHNEGGATKRVLVPVSTKRPSQSSQRTIDDDEDVRTASESGSP